MRLDQCVDDAGRSLIVGGRRTFAAGEGDNTWAWAVPLHLAKLEPGRRIRTLKGQFSVGVGLSDRYLTITNLLHADSGSVLHDGAQMGSSCTTWRGAASAGPSRK